jgi:hypothetical protein
MKSISPIKTKTIVPLNRESLKRCNDLTIHGSTRQDRFASFSKICRYFARHDCDTDARCLERRDFCRRGKEFSPRFADFIDGFAVASIGTATSCRASSCFA